MTNNLVGLIKKTAYEHQRDFKISIMGKLTDSPIQKLAKKSFHSFLLRFHKKHKQIHKFCIIITHQQTLYASLVFHIEINL